MSPLLAKPYVLDLAPGLSLADHLVERGLELFLLDSGIPDSLDRQLRFEDHLCGDWPGLRELLAQTGQAGDAAGLLPRRDLCHAATHPTNVQNLR